MLITPSGIPYEQLKPEMIASMPLDGEYGSWDGPLKPSTEWRFHLDIIKSRPQVNGVVHTHSTYATTIAITGRGIPACHYMIAAAGGPTIRCAPYARYGTEALSQYALEDLKAIGITEIAIIIGDVYPEKVQEFEKLMQEAHH